MKHRILTIILLLFSFFSLLLFFSIEWLLSTWGNLSMDEIIYELSTPLKGTGAEMISLFLLKCLLPALAVTILLILIYRIIKNSLKLIGILILDVLLILFSLVHLNIQVHVIDYIKDSSSYSDFIDNNYVDPQSVKIEFPVQKRNLIYIYLESMESTFADIDHGGAFQQNIIPELTDLAIASEDFSGSLEILNGAESLSGSTWTAGALFAQTSGLPLKAGVNSSNYDFSRSYYNHLTTLGDILSAENYRQIFLIGSYASFGSRDVYFKQHGNYDILDYGYAKEQKWIPSDYYEGWGFEDQKLFAFAKTTLLDLASSNEPFNLTMLTVDTHFPDGYTCDLCRNEFDDQYANVFACSNRQVADFVAWIQDQSFYDNTTIIISGDHPTMSANFCEGISDDYTRKTYTAYINAPLTPDRDKYRNYSTMDNFPTTLAALGVTIEGDRLGLGCNLFSAQETLLEKYGRDHINSELAKNSVLMSSIIPSENEFTDAFLELPCTVEVYQDDSQTNDTILRIADFNDFDTIPDELIVSLSYENIRPQEYHLSLCEDGSYQGEISLPDTVNHYCHLSAYTKKNIFSKTYLFKDYFCSLALLKHNEPGAYITSLNNLENVDIFVLGTEGAAAFMPLPDLQAFQSLGFKSDITSDSACVFYGLKADSVIYENYDSTHIEQEKTLANGIGFNAISSVSAAGFGTSLIIDDQQYCPNLYGLIFVVYDESLNKVIDRAVFNWKEVYPIVTPYLSLPEDGPDILKLVISYAFDLSNIYALYWPTNNPSDVHKTDLAINEGENLYSITLDLTKLNLSPDDYTFVIYDENDGSPSRIGICEIPYK